MVVRTDAHELIAGLTMDPIFGPVIVFGAGGVAVEAMDDTALALPDLFTRDPKQAAQLGKARASAATALERAEEEWLQASSQYDEAG